MPFGLIDIEDPAFIELGLDLVSEQSIERGGQITTSAIESGAEVADHVVMSPLRFTFSGLVVDEAYTSAPVAFPDPPPPSFLQPFQRQPSDEDPLARERARRPEPGRARARAVIDRLRAVLLSRTLTLVTEDESIPRMVLIALTERPMGRDAFEVQGTLEQIRLAEVRTRSLPPRRRAGPARRTDSKDREKESAQKAKDSASVKQDRRSLGALISDEVGLTGMVRDVLGQGEAAQ